MEKINILIADDHLLFAKLMSNLLLSANNVNIAGIASDGEETLKMIGEKKIDIVLLDIGMPKIDGLQVLKELKSNYPGIKIIVVSSRNDAWLIKKSLNTGALGYLTKSANDFEVLEAIKTVYNGESYCSQDTMKSIVNGFTHKNGDRDYSEKYQMLTRREKEILKSIASELTTNQIADSLNISIRTVETHRKNILQKLDVRNTVGLMKVAVKANMLDEVF